jgi:hypothetical protein
LRAGLIPGATGANTEAVSPYGVVAFGALAGWFSKRTSDKLAEVFETLFRTTKDLEYKDQLTGGAKPKIVSVKPDLVATSLAAGDVVLTLKCEGLNPGAQATLNDQALTTKLIDNTQLEVTIPAAIGKTLVAVAGGQLGSHFQRRSGDPVIHPAAAGSGPVA